MPRAADPAVRAALIEQAAQILAVEGPSRLTLRHLAAQVGTSTMAIYTHFGGMDQLRLEVCAEGFRRLAAHLAGVARTDDPVADLFALGVAYATNARENPHLYRAMFLDRLPTVVPVDVGLVAPDARAARADNTAGVGAPNGSNEQSTAAAAGFVEESLATFEVLVEATTRCVEAGRFTDLSGTRALAGQLWASTHGVMALELAGLIDPDQATMLLGANGRHLAIAFGDVPEAVDASTATALARSSS